MNKARRKKIEEIRDAISSLYDDLESVKIDEEDAFDNLPESLQESDRGESMQDAIDHLDSACDMLQEAIDELEDIE